MPRIIMQSPGQPWFFLSYWAPGIQEAVLSRRVAAGFSAGKDRCSRLGVIGSVARR